MSDQTSSKLSALSSQIFRGGGFVTGITRDPDTGKRYLNITAGAVHDVRVLGLLLGEIACQVLP